MLLHGTTVRIETHEQFEFLRSHPASVSGWFVPEQGEDTPAHGVVYFTSKEQAARARHTAQQEV